MPRPPDPASSADRRDAGLRDHLLRTFAILLVAGGSLFLLLCVAVPSLVDAHDDGRLVVAAALVLLCPVIVLLAVFRLRAERRRLLARG